MPKNIANTTNVRAKRVIRVREADETRSLIYLPQSSLRDGADYRTHSPRQPLGMRAQQAVHYNNVVRNEQTESQAEQA